MYVKLLLCITLLTTTTTIKTNKNRVNNRLSIIRDYNILCGFMWFGLRGFNLINILFFSRIFFANIFFSLHVTRTKPLFGKYCLYNILSKYSYTDVCALGKLKF